MIVSPLLAPIGSVLGESVSSVAERFQKRLLADLCSDFLSLDTPPGASETSVCKIRVRMSMISPKIQVKTLLVPMKCTKSTRGVMRRPTAPSNMLYHPCAGVYQEEASCRL